MLYLIALVCLLGMASTYRYRYGETNPYALPIKSGVAIELGDLLFIDASDSYTAKPAGSFTWVAAVAAAATPTGATETGAAVSDLTSGATGIKASYQFPWGEGTLSSAGSVNVTGNGDAITLHGIDLAAASPATGLNVYVETAQGSGIYKLYGTTQGESILITGYGTGRVPPTAIAQDATAQTQYGFHGAFAGVAAQAYDGSASPFGYGLKDGKIRADASGVFEYDCASSSFNVGDRVGPAKQTGNLLEPQKVALVGADGLAIGVVQEATVSQTKVKVRIFAPKGRLLS